MLWLCLHFPSLPLSALDVDGSGNTVVVDQHGSQRWLITGTTACAPGTALSQATALFPDLNFRVRRPSAEQALLQSLAHWIYRFGQPVVTQVQDLAEAGRLPRALLWVEIGASLKLFGGLDVLRDQIHQELTELGLAAQTSVAPTRSAAALRACMGRTDPIMQASDLRHSLHALPIRALHWPVKKLDALCGVGFRLLGDLFDIPRDAFSKRFGTDNRKQLDQLLGLLPEPFEAVVPPKRFSRRFELASEIEDTERLQFPLKHLCLELQAYLRSLDIGIASAELRVSHAGARQSCIHARFVDPHRDGHRVFLALKERLERDGLPLAARELTLCTDDFVEAHVPQHDLFDKQGAKGQQWSAVLERIRGRLGDDRLWSPRLLEEHRPEYATTRESDQQEVSARVHLAAHRRPTLLLDKPWPMPPPELAGNAPFERIESGWWDDRDVRRDYFTIDINGGRAWAFREVQSGQWFLHGWWA